MKTLKRNLPQQISKGRFRWLTANINPALSPTHTEGNQRAVKLIFAYLFRNVNLFTSLCLWFVQAVC